MSSRVVSSRVVSSRALPISALADPALGLAGYVTLRVLAKPWLERRGLEPLLHALAAPGRSPRPELARWLDAAERWTNRVPFVPRTCLYRSLARFAVLRRAGVDASFVMGVRHRDGELDGHAWIEGDELPVDPHAADFVPTLRYPPRPEATA